MITLAELKRKARRPWTSGAFLKSYLNDETLFPLEIPFRKPSGRELVNDFVQVRDWIALLHHHSSVVTGQGYAMEYRTINHQQLGQQRIPHRIVFSDQDDWLYFIGEQQSFKQFKERVSLTRRQLPQVMALVISKPGKLLEYADDWPGLLKVCRYFQVNPRPERYIRQLDITEVDTKFIETRKGILSEMLSLVLEPEDFDPTVKGVAEHGFERRFGLLHDEPLIRFRLFDGGPSIDSDHPVNSSQPVADISVPVSRFADPGVSKVYITENKVNGLAFPKVKDAIVIFGLGYGILSLDALGWLQTKQIFYWGDIDTHGFSILSRLRSQFPAARSLLMDHETLTEHLSLCVPEPEAKRFLGNLPNLTPDEQQLYDTLRHNSLGHNLRLEQERIGYRRVLQMLNSTG